jgi:hypothetical protein
MDKGHPLERALGRMVIPLKVPKKMWSFLWACQEKIIITLSVLRKDGCFP